MAKLNQVRDVRNNTLDKQAEKEKRSKVYTTERINQIVIDQAAGGEPDMNPFFHGQTDYRDAGIAFEYTEWEKMELIKCANDAVYFVENYCQFLNNKGRTTVKLRDYQKRLLNILTDEVYNEELDIVMPKNRRIVVMQSRQTGKCVTGDTIVDVLEGELSDDKLSFTQWLKEKWKMFISKLTLPFFNTKTFK